MTEKETQGQLRQLRYLCQSLVKFKNYVLKIPLFSKNHPPKVINKFALVKKY